MHQEISIQSSRKQIYRGILLSLASLLGYFLWRVWRYGWRLWRQPRLHLPVAVQQAATQDEIDELALLVATADVTRCIESRHLQNGEEKQVLCAGIRNFREPWARDFGFACFGLLAMGEIQTVREGLEVFLAYQRPSGQFPVKMHSTGVLDRYLHSFFQREQPIHAPMQPKYMTAHNTISLDGNALLVIAALNYAAQTADDSFAIAHWPQLNQAIIWLEQYASPEDGLLLQGAYTDWADSIVRTGKVLYTNVLYWRAVQLLAKTAERLDLLDAQLHRQNAARLRQAIKAHFWREELGYFVTSEQFKNLSSDGNLKAVAWGLTTSDQATAILNTMRRLRMAQPVPTQVTSYPYPSQFIGLENRLAGIPQYHTYAAWLWLGAWHVIALTRAGRRGEARLLLDRLNGVIVRDGVVHEVYGRNGRSLATRWYKSEAPLSWNASMVIYAHHVFNEGEQNQYLSSEMLAHKTKEL